MHSYSLSSCCILATKESPSLPSRNSSDIPEGKEIHTGSAVAAVKANKQRYTVLYGLRQGACLSLGDGMGSRRGDWAKMGTCMDG